MAEKEESLSSFWDYDLQPRLEPPTKRAKSSSCPLCAKKQAKLEQEQATNVELVRSIADLSRSKAEVVRELEAARAKLRSLELQQLQHGGGGVPQPAPPDPDAYGSGGGVAARPSTPSPSPPPPPCPFLPSGDTHDEGLSGSGGGGRG
ncbi:hypothetical protein Esi_0118_0020 [Ectocarpus siliculosus]|uniref:Uncharacterized protein n=1 Tax=Ectocarpus siliculosus TaxID=2880 RepID=D7FI69_ECTSI|nr:hypothetical protein Esi_0118_0020 [Ectocarpus siliculosus]|eukprot:CBJ28694.1 hypothetical protein Esi_0118_0020 [Ectocarpus siliculosus]